MKSRNINLLLIYAKLIVVSVLLFLTPFAFTGCGTPKNATTEAKVFNSLKTTYNTAKSAYLSHLQGVVNGTVSKENELKVDAAWNKFRLAMETAVISANGNWESATPEQIATLALNLITLIQRL